MPTTYTKTLARKILFAFLAFAIIFSVTALIVRTSITKKLANISKLANNMDQGNHHPEHILLLLHQAEDDFQASLLNTNSKNSDDYKTKLISAFNELDTLLKAHADTSSLNIVQSKKIKSWYQKKLALSNQLFGLKHNFDSLLTVYAAFNIEAVKYAQELSGNANKSLKIQTDTVKKITPSAKRSLFKRIKDAINNKDDKTISAIEINHRNNLKEVNASTQKLLTKDQKAYASSLRQLQQQNLKLITMQRELIVLNSHISNELERIINDIKELNYNATSEFRDILFKNYQETTGLLNTFSLIALFLVLVFATLLILFIIQLNRAELLLHKEIEQSVTIAQQKMDLLLHMSHEVRNPLTAIRGFLYIFGKTNLAKKQADMLDSIKHSSDMLLRTLNDTLDAAKMENSEFKISTEPFNPDDALKTVVESMEFGATKKGLTLDYHFKGDKDAILLGDSLRLKQIMVNLLSNAIKFTKEGGIRVIAELVGPENKLIVDVRDTGDGISPEQQSNLFSKYYQTSSSNGKAGTGLGLFICKQLIKLQDGHITVDSKPGAGTTFSFTIQYQKSNNEAVVKPDTLDPALLLNGITILAVDDNELDLMSLKMILARWNVNFLQAGNAKQALEIIAKNDVNVVLTAVPAQETDVAELLTALQKSTTSINKLPVIAISGVPADAENYLKMGFADIIEKSVVDTQLVGKLVKVLKPQAGNLH
ncbi:hybrid sensor histidine kinase/response regulator [Mucilaginibacter sp. KACC 22773]|uniref:ATP-binding response regulator n=1 Tax=Mucilaginibacter sp. KACC 22773 TaxID=3025671 RepID=UPI002366B978|nr:hybrid sensor histidine kinase/response regulator [Mucilaginibacter sp. KACC 22773]WDF75417.1 hybrid sensor histidine kinase/response regulator [Mucilaginibacter sp. KACC 22773]